MIELPENYVLADQINANLKGKKILNAVANYSPHKFAWYSGDPSDYQKKLHGKTITGAAPGTTYTCGGNTEIMCGDMLIIISTPIKYHTNGAALPKKHQLLLEFDDDNGSGTSALTCTVQMWGSMFCINPTEDEVPNEYKVKKGPSPLEDEFDRNYFDSLFLNTKKELSAKAFLATEQRIPGLGNGVLQDILWNAGVNPRTKLKDFSDDMLEKLFVSTRETLFSMAVNGGRDTERDLFGCPGKYKTVLSSKTIKEPCPRCGGEIIREAYLGGNIYYCPRCQLSIT